MLPQSLLVQLSPNAAKLYLVLLSLFDPATRIPVIQVSRRRLAELSALAPRTCTRALQQLQSLQLIRTRPHRYQKSATYLLLPPPKPQPPSAHQQATIPNQPLNRPMQSPQCQPENTQCPRRPPH